jgi:dinuclear metal center YbgI/SA1388 family protein
VRSDTASAEASQCAATLQPFGLKVPTTNSTATATVTAWEKMSQILRMTLNERMSDGKGGRMAERRRSERTSALLAGRFKDYGPNGLQVEGRPEVRRLVSGVTASLALIEAAVAAGADTILVHHGLFWRGQDGRLTGWLRQRVAPLLAHGINLFAYHLPLDAHAELGNNAQLGPAPGPGADARFGEQDLGFIGPAARGLADLAATGRTVQERAGPRAGAAAGRRPAAAARGLVHRWCAGHFEAAIAAGADAFLTGEISEPQAHLARETGVAFLACGHHATERYGAPAVAAHLAAAFGLEHRFIEIDNPA